MASALARKQIEAAIVAGIEAAKALQDAGQLPGKHPADVALIIIGRLDDAGFRIVRKPPQR